MEIETDPVSIRQLAVIDLTPEEAFAAFKGIGLPKEMQCSLETVSNLLKQQPIRKVVGTDIPGTTRCRLECLELWNGTKVYLGAGAEGAVVYRVSFPHSYVEINDVGRAEAR